MLSGRSCVQLSALHMAHCWDFLILAEAVSNLLSTFDWLLDGRSSLELSAVVSRLLCVPLYGCSRQDKWVGEGVCGGHTIVRQQVVDLFRPSGVVSLGIVA